MKKLIINQYRLENVFYTLTTTANRFYTTLSQDQAGYYIAQATKHPSDLLLFNDTYKDMFNNELSDTFKVIISRAFDDLFEDVVEFAVNNKVSVDTEILNNIFKIMINEANKAYSDYCEDEECYNQIVTITHVHNLFTFDDEFSDVMWNMLDNSIRDDVFRVLDKMFKGVVEIIETAFYEEEDTTK